MKKAILLFMASFLFLGQDVLLSQKITLDNVAKVRLRNSGTIKENDVIRGYYNFYKVDKVDRKNYEFLLVLLDEDLNEVSSESITASKYLVLEEGAYNGEYLCLKFRNLKEQENSFRIYDNSGKLSYTKTLSNDYKGEMMNIFAYFNNDELKGRLIFAVPGGFIHYQNKVIDRRLKSIVHFLPNEEGKGWKKVLKSGEKEVTNSTYLGTNGNLLLSSVIKRKNKMARDYFYYVQGIDLKTGEQKFMDKVEDTRYNMEIMSGFADTKSDNFKLFGMFYDKGEKIMKAKSKGICVYTMNPAGEIIDKKHLSWAKEIGAVIEQDERGKLADGGFLYFLDIVQAKDGNVFAIAERIKSAASAAGIVGNVLGGGGTSVVFRSTTKREIP